MVQSRGTARVAAFFGPVMLGWFVMLALAGLWHAAQNPVVFLALNPVYGIVFLADHGVIGLVTLGAVFLAVTGAEALYADLGHFGRKPIQLAWLVVVLPALVIELFRPGRAGAAHARNRRGAVLPDVPGLGAAADGGAGDGRDRHRQPGGDHRRLLAAADRRRSSGCCRASKSATRRNRSSARSTFRA